MPAPKTSYLARFFVLIIDVYRISLSPLMIQSCRYQPTCSGYARGAFMRYGAFRGAMLATKRIIRCHPLSPPEVNPLP